MALVLANRVQESATANTTVSFTLTGAVTGFQTFAVIGDTNTTYYSATDSSGNWEVGLGTYSTTGPTLTRTTIYASSNSGNAVTFSGTVNVFVTYPSGRSVNLDASGNVSALGTVASGTWQGSTIGVAYGGTGVTSSSGANSVMLRDANQNVAINRLNQANTDVTAAGGTTALTAASSYSQTLIGTGSQTFTMPDATTLTTGVAFIFNNNATGTVTLQDYATGSIGTITSGGAVELVLLANGTVAGTWDVHGFLPENVTWGTNALNMGSTVVSGGTWQGGTIQPAYGGTGLTTFVGANNALYSTGATTLTAGTLPVAAGGTGATTAAGALTSLGAFPAAGGTITGPTVVDVNSSSTALRITQTGTGNALVVEDSTNPDSTPFVVDANGIVIRGTTASVNTANYVGNQITNSGIQNHGTTLAGSVVASTAWTGTTGSNASGLILSRSAGTSPGSYAAVASGYVLGSVSFNGDDGTQFIAAASITAAVDGTPGTNDMPGRLVFSTTADGASSPTERMRIRSDGNVGLGNSGTASSGFNNAKNLTGATTTYAFLVSGQVQADSTSAAHYNFSQHNVAASATVSAIRGFTATQGTFGAGASVTSQAGFEAASSLTGATNNYGFYSNIASGTGRWNFYANGTADNYFAGNVGIGSGKTTPATALDVNGTVTATTFSGSGASLTGIPLSTGVTGTLPVANGGTGATSQTAYAVLCGGTTSTNPYQSVASVGTAGQVLTSNGAGALPTFQAAGGGFAAGTRMIFAQDAAPTGWTKDTTNYNNHALRVVTGTAGTTGGTVDFTTAFASQTPSGSVSVSVSGSVGNTTLGTGEIPSHTHGGVNGSGIFDYVPPTGCSTVLYRPGSTGATGGGGSHGHSWSGSGSGSFSGNAINLAVKYLNVITATKN